MEQTPAPARPVDAPLHMVLVTGMSGSGKSVALHALEDVGYRCMDNLPLGLLPALVQLQRDGLYPGDRLAVAVDVRNADALPHVPAQIARLRGMGVSVRLIFLDASTATLIRRFSETRRRHPLSSAPSDLGATPHTLVQDIEGERRLLEELRAMAHVIDTSNLRTSQLQGHVKDLLAASGGTQMTLVFQSFGFKSGLPLDSDYVFDVRMLPNPHYEPLLRPLDGRDAPVAQFLREHPQVQQMQRDIQRFLDCWLPRMEKDQRSYVTVAIGCTGGQHRSVFLTETLARHFARRWPTLCRHRALDDGKDVKLPPGPPHS